MESLKNLGKLLSKNFKEYNEIILQSRTECPINLKKETLNQLFLKVFNLKKKW